VDVIVVEPSASGEGAQGRNTYTCGISTKYVLCLIYRDLMCGTPDKVLVFFDTYFLWLLEP